jgi:hypothetical protein
MRVDKLNSSECNGSVSGRANLVKNLIALWAFTIRSLHSGKLSAERQ